MMIRKSTMTAESRALINHLRAHGPTSIADLCLAFPDQSKHSLSRRLHNMRGIGWLDAEGARGALVWSMHPDSEHLLPSLEAGVLVSSMRAPLHVRPVHKRSPAEPKPIDQQLVAQSRSYAFRPWVPSRPMALRAGSMDFRACPSRGVRC